MMHNNATYGNLWNTIDRSCKLSCLFSKSQRSVLSQFSLKNTSLFKTNDCFSGAFWISFFPDKISFDNYFQTEESEDVDETEILQSINNLYQVTKHHNDISIDVANPLGHAKKERNLLFKQFVKNSLYNSSSNQLVLADKLLNKNSVWKNIQQKNKTNIATNKTEVNTSASKNINKKTWEYLGGSDNYTEDYTEKINTEQEIINQPILINPIKEGFKSVTEQSSVSNLFQQKDIFEQRKFSELFQKSNVSELNSNITGKSISLKKSELREVSSNTEVSQSYKADYQDNSTVRIKHRDEFLANKTTDEFHRKVNFEKRSFLELFQRATHWKYDSERKFETLSERIEVSEISNKTDKSEQRTIDNSVSSVYETIYSRESFADNFLKRTILFKEAKIDSIIYDFSKKIGDSIFGIHSRNEIFKKVSNQNKKADNFRQIINFERPSFFDLVTKKQSEESLSFSKHSEVVQNQKTKERTNTVDNVYSEYNRKDSDETYLESNRSERRILDTHLQAISFEENSSSHLFLKNILSEFKQRVFQDTLRSSESEKSKASLNPFYRNSKKQVNADLLQSINRVIATETKHNTEQVTKVSDLIIKQKKEQEKILADISKEFATIRKEIESIRLIQKQKDRGGASRNNFKSGAFYDF